jgi:hypothetical protein
MTDVKEALRDLLALHREWMSLGILSAYQRRKYDADPRVIAAMAAVKEDGE